MATVIDPGAGAIAESIARLGDAFAKRHFEKENRERDLINNIPERQSLVPSYRAAKATSAQALSEFEETIGIRVGQADRLFSALQPTLQQSQEEAFVKAGGIGLQADVLIGDLTRQGRGISADLLNNIPEVQSEAAAATAGATTQESLYTGSIFRRRREGELDRLTVDNDVLKARADALGLNLSIEATQRYTDYFNNLDPNSHEYQAAVVGLSNPAELSHIANHENMDLEAGLRMAAISQQGEGDMMALTFEMEDRINEAVNALQKARDDGAEDSVIQQKVADVENTRLIAKTLIENGRMLPITIAGATGEGNDFEVNLEGVTFTDPRASQVLNQIGSEFELGTSPDEILVGLQAAAAQLNPTDREQLLARGTQEIERLTREQEARRPTVFGGLRSAAGTVGTTILDLKPGSLLPSDQQIDLTLRDGLNQFLDLVDSVKHLFTDTAESVRSLDPRSYSQPSR